MKRRFLAALVLVGGLFITSCQEDTAMDELILDTEMTATDGTGTGSGGEGSSGGNGDDPPTGN